MLQGEDYWNACRDAEVCETGNTHQPQPFIHVGKFTYLLLEPMQVKPEADALLMVTEGQTNELSCKQSSPFTQSQTQRTCRIMKEMFGQNGNFITGESAEAKTSGLKSKMKCALHPLHCQI